MAITLMWTLTINLTLDKERQSMHSYLANTLFSIDERIKDLGRATVVAVSDDRVQEILLHHNAYDKRTDLEAAEYLQELFLGTVSSRNEITALFLFDNSALIQKYSLASISIRSGFSVVSDKWFLQNLSNTPLMPNGTRLMGGQPGGFLLTTTLSNPYDNAYFIVLREINSFSPFRRIGHMMVAARMTTLNKIATLPSIQTRATYWRMRKAMSCAKAGAGFSTSHCPMRFPICKPRRQTIRWSCPLKARTAWCCRAPRPSAA